MSESLELVTTGAMPVDRPAAAPSPADILQAIVKGGVTAENVGALEKVVGLYERMEEKNGERQYAAALGMLQRETQNVIATKDVDGKFRYAPFLDIWNAVRPAVERNNFTLQWSQEHGGDKINVTLWLQHTPSGCRHKFTYGMRLGTASPGTPQGMLNPVLDSQSESRAKRRLLMDCLNIVVDAVTAAEDVGDGTMASDKETDDLFKRLVVLEPDDAKRTVSERRFLALAGVDRWNQVTKVALPILQRLMTEKERTYL